ncbi:unnamed protein product [Trifolium pratense]|uniref:Uncharacterized protein n=1 Tax=Trifolium pratense TaxID=57577 RepID=A0ACB0JB45_TRIPR|nr:unnamed protein product [Trifolium pratense]
MTLCNHVDKSQTLLGDVKICKTVDADTRFRMLESLNETSTKKKRVAETFDDEHPFGPNVVELADDDTSEIPRPAMHVSSSSRPPKRAATSQEVGNFFAPRTTLGALPTIKSVLACKKVVHEVDIAIATFFFENYIPMNALNLRSYRRMLDAVAFTGSGYKGPNYHAMRTRLLSDMKKNMCS